MSNFSLFDTKHPMQGGTLEDGALTIASIQAAISNMRETYLCEFAGTLSNHPRTIILHPHAVKYTKQGYWDSRRCRLRHARVKRQGRVR